MIPPIRMRKTIFMSQFDVVNGIRPEGDVTSALNGQGLNIAETSAALEISVPAVKTRLLRARLMVRDYFVSRSWASHPGSGKARP